MCLSTIPTAVTKYHEWEAYEEHRLISHFSGSCKMQVKALGMQSLVTAAD